MKPLILLCVLLTACLPPTELHFTNKWNAIEWVAEHIDYRTDEDEWGVSDYWQTPEETLDLRTGDCEDFVILDMMLLHELGQPSYYVGLAGHVVLRMDHHYIEAITGNRLTRDPDVEMEMSFAAIEAYLMTRGER